MRRAACGLATASLVFLLGSPAAPAGAADSSLPRVSLIRYGASPLDPPDTVSTAAGRCVAAITNRNFGLADEACSASVGVARNGRASYLPGVPSRDVQERNRDIAVAYTNRAVLRYLEGLPALARADIGRALMLAPGNPVVRGNAIVIESARTRPSAVVSLSADR